MGQEYLRTVKVTGIEPVASDIIFTDDFESQLMSWTGSGTGIDYLIERVKNNAASGGASLHIQTRATGAAADDFVTAHRQFQGRKSKIITVSSYFAFSTYAATKYLNFDGDVYVSGYNYKPKVRFDRVGGVWQYYDSGGTWQNIPSSPDISQAAHEKWHFISLTANFGSNQYGTLIIDDVELDLSSFSLKRETTFDHYLLWAFTVTANDANRPEMWIDNVIVRAS